MEKYDGTYIKRNFTRKFKKLLDSVYKELPERKRRSAFCKAYNDIFPREDGTGIEPTLKAWFSKAQKPTVEQLADICKMFNVDMDYFFTPQKTFNRDILNASCVTGLSEEAIEIMQHYDESQIELLDKTIRDGSLGYLLNCTYLYAMASFPKIKYSDLFTQEKELDSSTALSVFKYNAQESVNMFLENARENYEDKREYYEDAELKILKAKIDSFD